MSGSNPAPFHCGRIAGALLLALAIVFASGVAVGTFATLTTLALGGQ